MKRMKLYYLLLVLTFIVFACDSSENSPKLDENSLCAKWLVSGTSPYVSFEFNSSGNYLVVKKAAEKSVQEQTTIFGTYEIVDGKSVKLNNLGTLQLNTIDETSFNFKMKLVGSTSDEVEIQTEKSAVVANSAKTSLLCRTWNMVSINDKAVKGTEYEATILFSEAGTYYIDFANPGEENEDGLANWCWKDSEEKFFCYSWDGEMPTCDDNNQVEILELTGNVLKIYEVDRLYPEVTELYRLEPVSSEKSVSSCSNNTVFEGKLKGSFLAR